MKRGLTLLFSSLIALGVGCAGAAAQNTQGASTQGKKSLALVTNAAADFWTIARRGVEKAQKEHPDYEMEVIVTGQATAAEQRRELDDLLARGIAGVSISAIDPKNSTEEFNKVAAKAVLFTTDSDAPQSQPRRLYRHRQRRGRAVQAGEEIKKALPNGGKVMMFVGTMDADNARERVQGIKEAIAGTQDRDRRHPHRRRGFRQGKVERAGRACQGGHRLPCRPLFLQHAADLHGGEGSRARPGRSRSSASTKTRRPCAASPTAPSCRPSCSSRTSSAISR